MSDAVEEIIGLINDASFNVSEGYGDFGLEYYSSYLRQSVARVCALVDLLGTRLEKAASVLDVGAYFGSFALPLARLGFRVTAADQWDSYGSSFDGIRAHLKENGVETVNLRGDVTPDKLGSIGLFDCVISMAVIEHIPHTPMRGTRRVVQSL